MLAIQVSVVGFFFLFFSLAVAQPLNTNAQIDHRHYLWRGNLEKSVKCLADNIYYEAGNQSKIGKVAVAYTTLNRVLHHQFEDTICGVVYERNRTTCQFTWVCETRRFKPIHDRELVVYMESKKVAIEVLKTYNVRNDPTKGSLFYHAYYVDPQWKRQKLIRIQDHIFYK